MNAFSKLRFPKISFALFLLGALILIAIPVRVFLGTGLNLPADNADFRVIFPSLILPILIVGVAGLLIALLLFIPLRKKGIRFFDLFYPVSTAGAAVIFIFFHFALLA
jgi:hypothetical protein